MSDVFNTVENKQKISDYLIKEQPKGNTEDITYVPAWEPPRQSVDGSKTIASFLDSKEYKVFATRGIAELTPESYDQVFAGLNILTTSIQRQYVDLPVGDKEFIPSYRPPLFSSKVPDQRFLNQLIYQALKYADDRAKEQVRMAYEAAEKKMYGTGSLDGMLNRLVSMRDIREGRNGKFLPTGVKNVTYEDEEGKFQGYEGMARILEMTLPLGEPSNKEGNGPPPPLMYLPANLVIEVDGEINDELPSLKLNSAAGMPFVKTAGQKKKDVLLESIAIADMFLKGISDALKDIDPKKKLKKLLNDFWYLGCGLLFPKAERYDRSEWLTKTRNIWSAPTPTHILMSMISDPLLGHNKINTLNTDTPSMLKFNPFAGVPVVCARILLEQPFEMIYADNIYMNYQEDDGSFTWFSLDLEKGEANATPEDASAAAYYMLTRGWVDEYGAPAFNATWAFFATSVAPALAVDPSCLLYNMQFQFPGQGSGNSWTFIINHVVSSKLWYKWKTSGTPRPGSKRWIDMCREVGVNIKIEKEIVNIIKVLDDAADTSPSTGYLMREGDDFSPPTTPKVVDLDLLGFGAVFSPMLKRYVAVLSEERFWPSAVYPKKLDNRDFKDNADAKLAYEIVRYEALRYIGGWMYQATDDACKHLAQVNRERLERSGRDLEQFDVKDYAKFTEYSTMFEDSPTLDLTQTLTPESLVYLHRIRGTEEVESFGYVMKYGNEAEAKRLTQSTRGPVTRLRGALASGMLSELYRSNLEDYLERFKNRGPNRREENTFILKINEGLQEFLSIKRNLLSEPSRLTKVYTLGEQAYNPVVQLHLNRDKMKTGTIAARAGTSQTGVISQGLLSTTTTLRSANARKMVRRREKTREDNVLLKARRAFGEE